MRTILTERFISDEEEIIRVISINESDNKTVFFSLKKNIMVDKKEEVNGIVPFTIRDGDVLFWLGNTKITNDQYIKFLKSAAS